MAMRLARCTNVTYAANFNETYFSGKTDKILPNYLDFAFTILEIKMLRVMGRSASPARVGSGTPEKESAP
jgi:hypothetical protein